MNTERKWILIVGVLALIAGGGYRFGLPTGIFQSGSLDIEAAELQLAKYQKLAASRKPLESRNKALLNALEKAEKRLVKGQTSSLAAVQVQNRIKTIAEKSGATFRRMDFNENPDSNNPWYLPVQVQVSMRSTLRQLKDILYHIESDSVLMNVVDFKIRVIGGAKNDKGPITIETSMTVEGYMRWEESVVADTGNGA